MNNLFAKEKKKNQNMWLWVDPNYVQTQQIVWAKNQSEMLCLDILKMAPFLTAKGCFQTHVPECKQNNPKSFISSWTTSPLVGTMSARKPERLFAQLWEALVGLA